MSLRILHINEHLTSRGGIEVYLLGLLPLLEERGHESIVAFEHGDEALWSSTRQVFGLGSTSQHGRAEGRSATDALLDEDQPDLVHLHNIHNTGVVEACLERVPVVVTGHDYRYLCPASTFFFKKPQTVCHRTCGPGCFSTSLVRHCMSLRPRYAVGYYDRVRFMQERRKDFATVIAPSASAARRFRASGYPDEAVRVLPYFCPVPVDEQRPDPERSTVTYMGRLSPNKGFQHFIEAVGMLSSEVQGLLVGNVVGRESELAAAAQRAGCADRLTVEPWVDRAGVEGVLARTSVLVFPSIWEETLGIVGLEAMAKGIPVVASDIGGVREWLEDGRTGRLVSPGRPDEISSAVADILSDADAMCGMGRAGQEVIRRRFGPAHHVQRLEQIYEGAMGREVALAPIAQRAAPARVGVITPIPTPYRDAFWNALARQPGIELEVLYLAGGKPDRPWTRDWSWEYEAVVLENINLLKWRGPTESAYWCPGLKERLERGRFDVLLMGGYNHPALLHAMRFARRRGIPYLLMCESYQRSPLRAPKRWLKDMVVSRVVKHAAGGLPTGRRASDYLRSYGMDEARLWSCPNVPDLDSMTREIARLREDPLDTRMRLNLDDRAVVLFVGRLIDKKRPSQLIDAFAANVDPDRWQLVLVGDGPLRPGLERLVGRHGMQDHVRFEGHAQPGRVLEWYSAADAFVLPSSETWGVALIEALAAGLAVVVSDGVGCQVDFAPVGPGVAVVPEGDQEALGEAMKALTTPAPQRFPRTLTDHHHRPLAERIGEAIQRVARRGP